MSVGSYPPTITVNPIGFSTQILRGSSTHEFAFNSHLISPSEQRVSLRPYPQLIQTIITAEAHLRTRQFRIPTTRNARTPWQVDPPLHAVNLIGFPIENHRRDTPPKLTTNPIHHQRRGSATHDTRSKFKPIIRPLHRSPQPMQSTLPDSIVVHYPELLNFALP